MKIGSLPSYNPMVMSIIFLVVPLPSLEKEISELFIDTNETTAETYLRLIVSSFLASLRSVCLLVYTRASTYNP